MRLANKDVPARFITKLNKSIKFGGGVMKFGENDDYPNVIENVVSSSVTATATADIYAKFLTGGGFEQPGLNDVIVGRDVRGKEVRVLDLLRLYSQSVSIFNGFWAHVPYNKMLETGMPTMLNFKHCRFTKLDDTGYTPSMAFNKNFGAKSGFKAGESVEYDIFNSDKNVVVEQARGVGGINKYRGQAYFQFWDNRFIYPLSPYDPVYLDADTEWQVSLFKNRELRNGFMLRYILRIAQFESDSDRQAFIDKITGSEGADGARVTVLEDEFDEETGQLRQSGAFELDKIDNNVNDKLFENWESSLSNKIRKANKALPSILIDYENGKLGTTSGEAIVQAVSFYNGMTLDDRKLMSRVFSELFANSSNDTLRAVTDWSIKPFSLFIEPQNP